MRYVKYIEGLTLSRELALSPRVWDEDLLAGLPEPLVMGVGVSHIYLAGQQD